MTKYLQILPMRAKGVMNMSVHIHTMQPTNDLHNNSIQKTAVIVVGKDQIISVRLMLESIAVIVLSRVIIDRCCRHLRNNKNEYFVTASLSWLYINPNLFPFQEVSQALVFTVGYRDIGASVTLLIEGSDLYRHLSMTGKKLRSFQLMDMLIMSHCVKYM